MKVITDPLWGTHTSVLQCHKEEEEELYLFHRLESCINFLTMRKWCNFFCNMCVIKSHNQSLFLFLTSFSFNLIVLQQTKVNKVSIFSSLPSVLKKKTKLYCKGIVIHQKKINSHLKNHMGNNHVISPGRVNNYVTLAEGKGLVIKHLVSSFQVADTTITF